MEALSKLLIQAQNNNVIRGIRASIDGPRINHLFFADDALLFIRNKEKDVEEIVKILTNFSKDSCQNINKDKSMILFSPKTLGRIGTFFVICLDKKLVETAPLIWWKRDFH
ncbi:reverse transcriptase [Gossypium australe]|uniref:Reverse transcriptase n=1 Tax=Gossypium australe TaxID=47621 RepID=A0A5B6WY53_9ROSI|nr:reverse transcriptase [Gossypium australe]